MKKMNCFFVFLIMAALSCQNQPAEANVENNSTGATPAQGKRPNFEGTYSHEVNTEQFHGSLEIKHLGNDQFSFKIYAANADGCTSEISGETVIPAGSSNATYSSAGCEALNFTFEPNKVMVEEKGCESKHSPTCGFAGKYSMQ